MSVVVAAAAALLLRFGPRRPGAPLARRPHPTAVRPGADQPVLPAHLGTDQPARLGTDQPVPPGPATTIRTAPTAPSAPTARSAPEAVGAPVAAGAPTAPVPAPARRAVQNNGARHFGAAACPAARAHARP